MVPMTRDEYVTALVEETIASYPGLTHRAAHLRALPRDSLAMVPVMSALVDELRPRENPDASADMVKKSPFAEDAVEMKKRHA